MKRCTIFGTPCTLTKTETFQTAGLVPSGMRITIACAAVYSVPKQIAH